ncbi:hypothetical protein JXB41_04625 [Candidatus Woesearchaeota archaeon]|jgi:predicted HicB family RNase H-like nuclease|nr:hypothetical protein [Candidatus Woesearchaeota archaeon]
MKRVNIKLEEEIHTKAKIISVLKDITLNEYLSEAIEKSVEKDKTLLKDIKKKL